MLEPDGEVVAADGVVSPQHGGEHLIGPHHRARVCEGCVRTHLRGTDLEHDCDLARLGDPAQRLFERFWAADALGKQPDHPAIGIVREVAHHVGDVGDGLVAGRHDGAEADPGAE